MVRKKGAIGLVEQLRQAIRDSGLSLGQLERASGIGRDQLSRFVRGERGLGLEAAGRLFDTLGLRVVRPCGETPKVRDRKGDK
jgi:predicted transcriptional regulator